MAHWPHSALYTLAKTRLMAFDIGTTYTRVPEQWPEGALLKDCADGLVQGRDVEHAAAGEGKAGKVGGVGGRGPRGP